MTLDTTPDSTTSASTAAGSAPAAAGDRPVKAPRRRATRKTAAPSAETAPAAAATEAAPATVSDQAAPAAASAEAAPAASARAPRKAAAKKAPAKRATSTRAAKKAVAPVDAPVAPAEVPAAEAPAPEQPAAQQPAAEQAAEPELSAAAKRSASSTFDVFAEFAAAANAPAKAPRRSVRRSRIASEPVVTPAASVSIVSEPTVSEPVVPEPAATAPAAPADEAPVVHSATELLFQAPDATTRPRRRRAQSPAGPPRAADTRDDQARAHQSAPVETSPAADLAVEDEDEAIAEIAVAMPPRRASRRRGSSRAADAVDELEPAAATQTAVPAAAVAGSADENATEQASDEPADDDEDGGPRRRRRRGGRGRRGRSGSDGSDTDQSDADNQDNQADGRREHRTDDREPRPEHAEVASGDAAAAEDGSDDADETGDADGEGGSSRRRRRRRRSGRGTDSVESEPAPQARTRGSRSGSGGSGSGSNSNIGATGADEVTALRGSTRLEAKRQRRREGRDAGRRRTIITESEFLARRESVDRTMVVREIDGATQIAVMEDGVLVEHYVSRQAQASMAGNVYLGRVQNVLPSMEAAFIDVGKGRNAVLYAGEVNWDAAGLEGQPRRIEQALKSGDSVLVQVTKDPIGQKGARLTSQVTLAGRYLVYVPGGGMTGISRKLPDNERARLKKLLREIVPDSAGVIVRTAAEGASEDELRADILRLQEQWTAIEKKAKSASAPALLQGEPDLAIRVVRDIFNGDFGSLVVQGDEAWDTISGYIGALAPDLAEKVTRWTGTGDVFSAHRVDEQLAKGMDRKVWLPSGGSLVIDRTEAMTVVDVNTGKFTGAGGTLEETVTRNNLEAAEEIVRQLRLRDIGGIIVIDFIDMVLESNRDLVLRRLVECLGRDRTKHQVAEVTSLGLVQMTRKRVGQGLVEAFSETCEHCMGRGFIVHTDPIEKHGHVDDGLQGGHPQGGHSHGSSSTSDDSDGPSKGGRRKRGGAKETLTGALPLPVAVPVLPQARAAVKATLATIAAAAAHAHDTALEEQTGRSGPADLPVGFDSDEGLELFPVAPEVFAAGSDGDAGTRPASSQGAE
ncbi:ribonuclease E/G [Pengzhenrongella sicca]|uniref:Ribonuclease E n=1 Tax=Pengzhenrongella sicca TaxID=2819238 RepID=A0A8A4Z9R6_9MICO|nr:ribonuclease E/G [Pengzhenrongella sicca]QTE28642.1 Rne/Rng family ribonuclease [Pengzhenrongella sicca]